MRHRACQSSCATYCGSQALLVVAIRRVLYNLRASELRRFEAQRQHSAGGWCKQTPRKLIVPVCTDRRFGRAGREPGHMGLRSYNAPRLTDDPASAEPEEYQAMRLAWILAGG